MGDDDSDDQSDDSDGEEPPGRDDLPALSHSGYLWRWRHHKWRIVGHWTDSKGEKHKCSVTAELSGMGPEERPEIVGVLQMQLKRRIDKAKSS